MNLFLDIKKCLCGKNVTREESMAYQSQEKPLSRAKIKGPAHKHGEDAEDEEVSQ